MLATRERAELKDTGLSDKKIHCILIKGTIIESNPIRIAINFDEDSDSSRHTRARRRPSASGLLGGHDGNILASTEKSFRAAISRACAGDVDSARLGA